MADAPEQPHQFHEMTTVPPELSYVPEAPSQAGSVGGLCFFLFSAMLAAVVSRFEHTRNGHSSSVNFLAMRDTGV